MHDHATDGGRRAFEDRSPATVLRRHMDNAHDTQTNGLHWLDLAELHRKAHKAAEMEAAANEITELLAAAPLDWLYLTDATGTVYLAEQVDPRHMPAAGPLYRLTAQVPPAERVVDLLEQTKASLAATRAYLDAHKESGNTQPPDRPGEASSEDDAVDALPAPHGGAS